MTKTLKTLFVLLIVALAGGLFWWQQNKKKLIKDTIQNAIRKKTDSLYVIRYDSSKIDEIAGNASFYNVSLQSESAKKELLASTDSLPNSLIFIRVKEISASGVDMAGLLQNTNVTAKKILLLKPTIQILNTGANNPKPNSKADTLEFYKRLLGKFNSIKADRVEIDSGQVIFTDRDGKPLTTMENINIDLKNFLVDSVHSYNNLISYFIKDIRATVDNIQLPESKNKTRMNISGFTYDASAKSMKVNQLHQYRSGDSKALVELNNIVVTQLNTDAFVMDHQLRAGLISCNGGMITIFSKSKNDESKKKEFELETDFDTIQVGGLKLGKTKLVIVNANQPTTPLIINDLTFDLMNTLTLESGNTLTDIINNADWKITASGIEGMAKNNNSRLDINNININKSTSSINIGRVAIIPNGTEADFVRQSTKQRDRFDIAFSNISLNGVNFKRLINNEGLEVDHAALQATVKIFNDRTLPPDLASKVGKAPYQNIMKLNFPLFVNQLQIINSLIEYKERAAKTGMTGIVNFTNLNGLVSNITNMPDKVKLNPTMKVLANCRFLGKAALNSTWLLPLITGNGNFSIGGTLGAMNANALNPIIEPLGMASVSSGNLNKTTFNITGNDNSASGIVSFLYNDLHVEVLKKTADQQLKKRGVLSALANSLVKTSNPSKGNAPITASVVNNRDNTKSFFNLVWKTIFKGVKQIALVNSPF